MEFLGYIANGAEVLAGATAQTATTLVGITEALLKQGATLVGDVIGEAAIAAGDAVGVPIGPTSNLAVNAKEVDSVPGTVAEGQDVKTGSPNYEEREGFA